MAVKSLQFELVRTIELTRELRRVVLKLLDDAYGEDLDGYLREIGPGVHLLGRVDGMLVAHAMIVERTLEIDGERSLRTAYVELLASAPSMQGRGYASALLTQLVEHMTDYEIAALSPVNAEFYSQFGWELWRGPLSARTPSGPLACPYETAMILRLPRTPEALDLDLPLSVEWRPGEVW